MEVPLYNVGSVVPFVSFGLIVLMSLFVNDSTEVVLGLACVVKLVVDDSTEVALGLVCAVKLDFMLSNVEVTWIDDFKVAIVVFSDVTPALTVWFGSELANIKSATNMQIPIKMKAVKNNNKQIKINFWDAMLFYASLQSLNILHNMSINIEFT